MNFTRLIAALSMVQIIAVSAAALFFWQSGNLWIGLLLNFIVAAAGMCWVLHRQLAPCIGAWQGVVQGLQHFADGDFAVALPDLGGQAHEVVQMRIQFNLTAEQLQRHRYHSQQREIMLQTLLEQINSALLLVDASGKIVLGNPAARDMLSPGRVLAGQRWAELLQQQPPNLALALAAGQEGLITLEAEEGLLETWQLNYQRLVLRGQTHSLWHIKPLTQALNRAEVNAWKNLIRVFSHELNNSLGPMHSLANSGQQLAERVDEPTRSVLTEIFTTFGSRTRHLTTFLSAYSQIARLPKPLLQSQDYGQWLTSLQLLCHFQLISPVPERPGLFDPAQLSQVLINLIKNSIEAGAPVSSITMSLQSLPQWDLWRLEDGGSGMTPSVLAQALLPFYSTKREGTGLGLALCREIIEAHQGRLYLHNRHQGGLRVDIWLPGKTVNQPSANGITSAI